MNTVFRVVNPVCDMDKYICKVHVFTKQAEYKYNTVFFSSFRYSTCRLPSPLSDQFPVRVCSCARDILTVCEFKKLTVNSPYANIDWGIGLFKGTTGVEPKV